MEKHFYLILSFLLLVFFAIHALFYEYVVTYFPYITHGGKILLIAALSLLCFSFIPSFYLTFSKNNTFTRFFYRISAFWAGLIIYILLSISFTAILIPILSLFSFEISTMVLGWLPIVVAVILCFYGWWNAYNIRISRISFSFPKTPDIWKGRKIVFLSDTHFGQIYAERFAKKAVAKINELHPDLVLFGGDFYDGPHMDFERVAEVFKELKSSKGVFYVSGNHDHYVHLRVDLNIGQILSRNGFRVLHDEVITIDGLQIIGIDYSSTETKGSYENVISSLSFDRELPTIVVKHVPDFLNLSEKTGAHLLLSGHTHNAQLFPFQFIPRIIYKGFSYGLKTYNRMKVYTSSGVGTWGPPIRIGTKSEIVLITLE